MWEENEKFMSKNLKQKSNKTEPDVKMWLCLGACYLIYEDGGSLSAHWETL